MDYQVQTETFGVDDLSWLANADGLRKYGVTMFTTDLVEATHYPDGYVKPGILVALFTGGAGNNLWTPWVEDGANGEDTIGGIVYSGFEVRKNAAGSLVSTTTTGAILLAESGVHLITSKIPNLLLTDGTTTNVVSDANLTGAGFTVMNLGV